MEYWMWNDWLRVEINEGSLTMHSIVYDYFRICKETDVFLALQHS